jgi:hypothetical protein
MTNILEINAVILGVARDDISVLRGAAASRNDVHVASPWNGDGGDGPRGIASCAEG